MHDLLHLRFGFPPAMEIPSLAACQRVQYENELLRKKVVKLLTEKDEFKLKLEISERNLGERKNEDFVSSAKYEVKRNTASPSSKDNLEGFSSSISEKLNALANGRELRPNKIITDEGKRLHSLIDMQNKVIQRYEIQLNELKTYSLKCDELTKEIDALKRESEKRLAEAGDRTNDDERVELLLREVSSLKKENYDLAMDRNILEKELSSLDPEFFEEIEDLKFSLIQARRLSKEYEKTIYVLSNRLGISPPLARKL